MKRAAQTVIAVICIPQTSRRYFQTTNTEWSKAVLNQGSDCFQNRDEFITGKRRFKNCLKLQFYHVQLG